MSGNPAIPQSFFSKPPLTWGFMGEENKRNLKHTLNRGFTFRICSEQGFYVNRNPIFDFTALIKPV